MLISRPLIIFARDFLSLFLLPPSLLSSFERYGKEVPKKKVVAAKAPAFAPDAKITEKTMKKRAKASSSGYGVRTATPKKTSTGPKMTFTPDTNVSARSAKLRAKAVPKIYASPRPRTAPPHSRTGVVQHEKALRYTLAADRTTKVQSERNTANTLPMQQYRSRERRGGSRGGGGGGGGGG